MPKARSLLKVVSVFIGSASISRHCRGKKVMVPKVLVPDNTTLAACAIVEERFVDDPTQRASIFVRESTRGELAPRKTLFAEAMLETAPIHRHI
jgi:hypothetical protein